jgi:hypothetical protein
MKNRFLFTIFLTIVLFGFSCKKANNSFVKRNNFTSEQNNDIFLGDSIIIKKKYFENLSKAKGYSILKTQNALYEKNYLNFEKNSIKTNNIDFKFEKQLIKGGKKYRIVMYTFVANTKKDSIEFYRNVDDLKYEPSNFTSLSYLDLRDKKIWQIKYFSSPVDKSVGYVLFERSKINENGKIESDSLYYLDESLDVEMEKNNLYF